MGWFTERRRRKIQAEQLAAATSEIRTLLNTFSQSVAAAVGGAVVPPQPKPDGAGNGNKDWVNNVLEKVKEKENVIVPKAEMKGTIANMAHDFLRNGYDWEDTKFMVFQVIGANGLVAWWPMFLKWLNELQHEES